MNLYIRRQQNLLALIESQFGGSRVGFCNMHDITESRLAQFLSLTYRDGRGFGERAARELERKLNLPSLYFEREIQKDTLRETTQPYTLPHQEQKTTTKWGGIDNLEELTTSLSDVRNHASPQSQITISKLILLANQNALTDDDWRLIQQLANKIHSL